MKRNRSGFTIVELLVAIVIIAILIALLLPAVQAARESARILNCKNNQKQIGIAFNNYENSFQCLPPAVINCGYYADPTTPYKNLYPGGPNDRFHNHSGFTLLLPFLEQQSLYDRYDFSAPASHFNNYMTPAIVLPPDHINITVISTRVHNYECPTDDPSRIVDVRCWFGGYPTTKARTASYRFNLGGGCEHTGDWKLSNFFFSVNGPVNTYSSRYRGPFGTNHSARFSDIKDGLSNTYAVGESKQNSHDSGCEGNSANVWGAAGEGALGSVGITDHPSILPIYKHLNAPYGSLHCGLSGKMGKLQFTRVFGSWHTGGANFLLVDGSVQFVRNNIDSSIYEAMGTISNGEANGPP